METKNILYVVELKLGNVYFFVLPSAVCRNWNK